MNWLITGGAGFIGLNLIKLLVKKKNYIYVVDKNINKHIFLKNFDKNEKKKIKIYKINILKKNFFKNFSKPVDYVVHLAASTGVLTSIKNPDYDAKLNILGTLNLLNFSKNKKIKKFIFASSGAVFGNANPPFYETDIPNPITPYGCSKLASENYCNIFSKTYSLPCLILRFSNIFGEFSNKKKSVISKFVRTILENKTITINGHGTQTRDFLYVKDLVVALYKLSRLRNLKCQVYHICSGREVSINMLLKKLQINFKDKIKKKYTKSKLVGDARRSFSSNKKIINKISWKLTKLDRSLNKTIEWYKINYLK